MNCTEKLLNKIIMQLSCIKEKTLLKKYLIIMYKVKYCCILVQIAWLRKESVKKTQQFLSWKKMIFFSVLLSRGIYV